MTVEDLVAEEEVPKQSGIRVGEVEGLVQDDVSIVAEVGMEGVVLQMGGVQVGPCVLVHSELPNQLGEVLHGIEVRVAPPRCHETHTHSRVRQLVIPLKHQRWRKERLVLIVHSPINLSPHIPKMLAHYFVEGVRVDVASTRDYDALAHIVLVVEVLKVLGSDGVDIVANA